MFTAVEFLDHLIVSPFVQVCKALPKVGQRLRFLALMSGLFALTPATQAAFFQNSSGLSDPHATITFSEHAFPDGTGITSQYADLGVTFSPFALYFSGVTPDGPGVTSFFPYGTALMWRQVIQFSQPQTKAAFQFWTYAGAQCTFQALLNGTAVETATASDGCQ